MDIKRNGSRPSTKAPEAQVRPLPRPPYRKLECLDEISLQLTGGQATVMVK
jgi:hypothetical protein